MSLQEGSSVARNLRRPRAHTTPESRFFRRTIAEVADGQEFFPKKLQIHSANVELSCGDFYLNCR